MEKFAFILHPISYQDLTRKYSWANYLPSSLVLEYVKRKKPFIVSHIKGIKSTFTGEEIEGFFIACPLITQQMVDLPLPYVYNKIIESGRLAQEAGAKIVGLGAFTSVVGDGGITIKKHLDIDITTGNSYTVASAIEGTYEALKLLEVEAEGATLAVVGATGSIGKAVALLMAPSFKKTYLVGRNADKTKALISSFQDRNLDITYTTSIVEGVKEADAIITVSSAVEEVIHPEMLKPGSVVCDVARPRDVSPKVAKARNDVLVIEGGVVQVPGNPSFNFNFGFPPGLAYACMSETMILTLEKRYDSFSIGKDLDIEKVKEISGFANKHGFKLAGFRCFEKVLNSSDIYKIKENAIKNRRR
ncbi:MAG: Aminotransferase PigE [candidate division WS2 bacterium]|nr:Aminotransferase PigE [Candidatus Psychracetigena formicireducens]